MSSSSSRRRKPTPTSACSRGGLQATDQPMILPGPVAAVGMSIGMAILEPGTDPTQVLSLADHDMYQMKSRRATQTRVAYGDRR